MAEAARITAISLSPFSLPPSLSPSPSLPHSLSLSSCTTRIHTGAMDPLLATLANFTSPQHLTAQIQLLFCLWDVDDKGVFLLPSPFSLLPSIQTPSPSLLKVNDKSSSRIP